MSVAMCAYHPDKMSETRCGSCDKALCLIDTFTWAPLGANPMEVCAECEDFFRGKDKGKREQFRMRIFIGFLIIVAAFGVSPALDAIFGR